MKPIKCKTLLSMLLFLMLGMPLMQAETFDSTKKKVVDKSFPISKSNSLYVDNRFGSITITHWNKSEAFIRVEIEAVSSNETAAQNNLDRVAVNLRMDGNKVSAVTTIRESKVRTSGKEQLVINYFISIPSDMEIDLSQRYGNINLPSKNDGKSNISVKYGNLQGGSLTKPLNLDASYSNVNLRDLVEASIDLAYCGDVEFGSVKKMEADTKYSSVTIKESDELRIAVKYGKLAVDEANKVFAEMKYSNAKIRHLKEELRLETLDYSTLEVNTLDSKFKTVDATSRYGTLEIGVASNASFSIDAERTNNLDISNLKETKHTVEDKTNHFVEINGGSDRKVKFAGNKYSNLKVRGR